MTEPTGIAPMERVRAIEQRLESDADLKIPELRAACWWLVSEAKRLDQAFAAYGQHRPNCSFWKGEPAPLCDCGLSKARKGGQP